MSDSEHSYSDRSESSNPKRGVLSQISPLTLIAAIVVLIMLVPFLSQAYEFIAVGVLVAFLAVLGKAGWKFWVRYLKLSFPLVVLSLVFNWILFLPSGLHSLWGKALFSSSENLRAFYNALVIGGRFSLALFFSFFLLHISTRDELVWGLAEVSEKLFRSPATGEVLALTLLSAPFFLESLSKVRKWRQVPVAIAEVFHTAQTMQAPSRTLLPKKSGLGFLITCVFCLAAAVVLK